MLAERYRLDGPLGHGGMGEVWQGWDTRLSRPVAVKLLAGSAADDEDSVQRFHREARTAARLNDPHVVAVYDFGISEGSCFLVMELVDGSNLADELGRDGPLSLPRVGEVAAQAAAGLAAAHRRGVVHRDVKPSNLLVAEDGTVKIADFGIARGPAGDTSVQATRTGTITGTSLYLAPETALGQTAESAGDVYSLGCALYELLTGRPPFVADTPIAVLCQHVESEPAAPGRLRPELPGDLGSYLLRMLAKSPAERPTAQQAADWFADCAWHHDENEEAGPGAVMAPETREPAESLRATRVDQRPAPVAGTARRRRALLLAGTAAAVAAAATVLAFGPPLSEGGTGPGSAPAPSHSATPSPSSRPTGPATTPGNLAAPANQDHPDDRHGGGDHRGHRGHSGSPHHSTSGGGSSPGPKASAPPSPTASHPTPSGPTPTPSGPTTTPTSPQPTPTTTSAAVSAHRDV